ncbi:claudin-10 isoform X3 [Podarcis muralis]|uniref:claudin-10 isoform X4 n=1 Tax=Podarcis raffonei TaxID=65483 RepID=UPI0023297FD1|nr:claudin-10 isoform X4 [Podarcis raffonei]
MANSSAEILAFLLVISGWVLVSSTLPTDYWKVSTIDGTVITTATFWANLWKTCVTDSTGVSNCKDFPSMLALDGYIQACRGLMIAAVCLGFFGSVFALVGMKCTKIGGSDQTKAKIACLAGFIFILCGLCAMAGCSLYANRITSEFFDPTYIAQKMGYTYNRAASAMSIRTKGCNGSADLKMPRAPPKHFDKNAYV